MNFDAIVFLKQEQMFDKSSVAISSSDKYFGFTFFMLNNPNLPIFQKARVCP